MPELLLAGRIKNKKPVGNYRNDDDIKFNRFICVACCKRAAWIIVTFNRVPNET